MMKKLIALGLLFLLSACTGISRQDENPYFSGRLTSGPQQCVPYARKMSGMEIYGNAHSWFDQAAPRYAKGTKPKKGAVMVLARTDKMPHGHLAVVTKLIDDRHIDVTHSNWGNDRESRSMIYDRMRVEDVSKANDWSAVKFWNPEVNAFGFPYKVRGFIYK